MDYISVKDASEKWGISERRIQKLCEENRITGTLKFGRAWMIPKDIEKPADGRCKAINTSIDKGELIDISNKIKCLYQNDTKSAYSNLLELEAISEGEAILYSHLNEFIAMLKSEKYVVRVRGFRLLCKQAKWDVDNIIDKNIEKILFAVHDKKPTAVRQALQYLRYIIPFKKRLHSKIKDTALSIDCSQFKETMRPLIEKDIHNLMEDIEVL